MFRRPLAIAAFVCIVTALALAQDLRIQALPAQGAIVGESFLLALHATGGTQPYVWQLVSGDLPPGCKLNSHNGRVAGVPTTPGDYHFSVAVTDASIPQLRTQRDLTVHVIAGLTIEWKDAPRVQGNNIAGSVLVHNQTPGDFDLTVLVVAVNESGRATALGYQHFKLSADATSPVIPFGSSPGAGTYHVRADAVAHHPGHGHAYRTSKTTDTISIVQP